MSANAFLFRAFIGALLFTITLFSVSDQLAAQDKLTLTDEQVEMVSWRSIGPANMGGRITSLAVYEKDPCIWWAASASGGLLKTTNNGVTFEHQFDDQATVSIGDVQVSQSDPNIVWVGTGEANPRNSVSWGDGVYKSTDGGATWTNMGLKKIFQTGRIAIHPKDPNIVYVGALGRLWGPSEDRGLFKTTDGGENWEKILYIDDKTGVVDVQMNMKNPDKLIVATYQRKRDGFDGNDPEVKYGEGSGIYCTEDGGKNFEKCIDGLPSCNLGRVGLSIYRKDPKYIYAIIESEKIAKEPENAAFVGITRGEDVEVGAKITQFTEDTPAAKAGILEGDIVVQVDDDVIHSYRDLQESIRKNLAGDKVKWIVSREKETVELNLEYAAKPGVAEGENGQGTGRGNRRRTPRSPFTGTLGGQAANLQGQQGDDEHEYGGVYMSKNSGKTWTRINTLNPRPMYYSQIRVDPSDRNYIYVCGTSLYRSKDGGETFTGDGGSGGIHVDHHSLYIDPNDGRHLILGNDGGIYVTYDRMEHWDHHNHVAIGQFYHVGIGPNKDFHVYGGLQDNGSWGGPVRTGDGGPVNSDWYNVGGGDGFVTLVDPTDKDQIYSESQNGAMSTRNFRTGQRGSLSPRRERGSSARYRFNWKTPFILSPHNPKSQYSAGNHVFKSSYLSNGVKAISPDITNTDKGAGSAITESYVEEGVIYVGTTDGAVWMTKNGGKEWLPIFSVKEAPAEGDESDERAANRPGGDSSENKAAAPEKLNDDDQISGVWEVEMQARGGGGGRGGGAQGGRGGNRGGTTFTLQLKENGVVTGAVESQRGANDISDGKYDEEKKKLTFLVSTERGDREYTADLSDGALKGSMNISMGERSFEMEFNAKKKDDDQLPGLTDKLSNLNLLTSIVVAPQENDDPISGIWKGQVTGEQLPDGGIEITVVVKMDDKGLLSGSFSAPDAPGDGELDIVEGKYNSETKKLYFYAENDEVGMDGEAKFEGSKLVGDLQVNDQMTLAFSMERTKADAAAETTDSEMADDESESKVGENSQDEAPAEDDAVAGKWEGNFISEQMPEGASAFTMNLKRDAKGNITGDYETQRGSGDITEGKYDSETGTINMAAESNNFTLEFDGKLKDEKMDGEVTFNGGFSLDFEAKRTAKTKSADVETSADVTEEKTATLESLLPGPRWVSSLEASHSARGRCYISLDGHRSNDDKPYAFVSDDYGQTWKSILADLPDSIGSVRVVREDRENENILYLGCEFSSWVSIDRGKSWTRLKGIPTVSVHEFAQHPTTGDIVAGTHGRSLWVGNVSALRQMSAENLKAKVALMKPTEVIRWQGGKRRGASGTRRFVGERPPTNTTLVYSLGSDARSVSLEVHSPDGRVIRDFETPQTSKGVHIVNWDLRTASRGGNAGRGGNRRFGGGPTVPAGDYVVMLQVDGETKRQVMKISPDPSLPSDAVAEDENLTWWLDLSEKIEID